MKIQNKPCDSQYRSHQEAKITGFLRNLNETGEKLKRSPVTYNPSSIPCTDFYVPLPWDFTGSSSGSQKE